MKLRKIVLVVGLMAVFTMLTPGLLVWAGGPEPPDADAIIQDTELWGVVVVYCHPNTSALDRAVVRVKRIVDCNIETQALFASSWTFGCPADSDAPLNWSLPAGTTFFDIAGTPFISKVKNFMQDVQLDGDVYSFDAQFKFWLSGPTP